MPLIPAADQAPYRRDPDATPLAKALAAVGAYGVTASAVARAAGVSSSYISRLAAGERTPSFEAAARISHALGVDVRLVFPDQAAER